ncbi:Biotin--[acetyl-CoA carboxylase] synthetase protein [Pseudorhizobium banfieldiae]|uniref:biotin--[biotin carboxyl-carrier protein] ligase n=1 Tax=Pseudorhizobium banfieldiae TaxID=1125847 RepID=L0NDP3_9HYPH|nr:biotin--[acetyl-CoA-carboxylase] ligase [Pseudorhizobium banfieldiae]CAD6605246.1 biotin--[acetyl-CoA-carboxylase] ligase [arsenite-oxidising bacterium NT-25]CCF19004.1 Biotin--[acetyl-CoA carboxylase] synthetase protein [Pseudorhizobium banfieldiae]
MARSSGRFSLEAFRHEALGDVGSTNTECLARARAGDPGHLWVTATRQTSGRGRRGRTWTSEPGNLYASLLLLDPAPMERLGSLPLAVALAVHGAVSAVLPAGSPPVEVKWPNDILIRRRKTCGILIEGEQLASGRHAIVIGIGINIRHMPDDAAYGVTRLEDHGFHASPDELFARLFREMAAVLDSWDEGRGVTEISRKWLEVACGVGEKITVKLTDRSVAGRFKGIDAQGLLSLETGDGQILSIAAGDVFFARTE